LGLNFALPDAFFCPFFVTLTSFNHTGGKFKDYS